MRKAKKSVPIEVLAPSRPSDEANAMLARLVEQKVNEALASASGDSIFQPFFQPQPVAEYMKRQMTVSQQQKFAAYFEEWGCMRCDTKKTSHMSLGMCPMFPPNSRRVYGLASENRTLKGRIRYRHSTARTWHSRPFSTS